MARFLSSPAASATEGESSNPSAPTLYEAAAAFVSPYLPKSLDDDEPDAMSGAINRVGPVISKLTLGSIMGYCSGAATKKIGKALAVTFGVLVMAVQGAAYTGYIEVKMDRIQSDLAKTVDKDRDGKVNMNDFKLYWSKFRTMMLHNVSRENAAGFSLGFLYGITNA